MSQEQELLFNLDKKLDKIIDEQKSIKKVLVGDPEFHIQGLIDDIVELKAFMKSVHQLKWYSLGALGFATAIFGIVKYLKDILK